MEPMNVTPPVNPTPVTPVDTYRTRRSRSGVWPFILILAGTAILADNLGIRHMFDSWMKFILPLGMIAIGAYYLIERTGNHSR